MKLVRESIKLGTEYNGKWWFTIDGNNADELEAAQDRLSSMETGSHVVRADGSLKAERWNDYCDGCPCYEDGHSAGYWIPVDMVDSFKAAWKIAKKTK